MTSVGVGHGEGREPPTSHLPRWFLPTGWVGRGGFWQAALPHHVCRQASLSGETAVHGVTAGLVQQLGAGRVTRPPCPRKIYTEITTQMLRVEACVLQFSLPYF